MIVFVPNPSFPQEWARSDDARRLAEDRARAGLRHAQSIAPVRTGEYRASLAARAVLTDEGWVGLIYSDAAHAPFLEWGTSDTPTFATLRRALEASGR